MNAEKPKNRIREIRKFKGMTQHDLAEAIGTDKSQIARLEKGERRLTTEWLEKLAGALGCTPVDLMVSDYLPSPKLSLDVNNLRPEDHRRLVFEVLQSTGWDLDNFAKKTNVSIAKLESIIYGQGNEADLNPYEVKQIAKAAPFVLAQFDALTQEDQAFIMGAPSHYGNLAMARQTTSQGGGHRNDMDPNEDDLARAPTEGLNFSRSNNPSAANRPFLGGRMTSTDMPHFTRSLPVYGRAVLGTDGIDVDNWQAIQQSFCPPSLRDVKDAFAIYANGDAMAPRYNHGNLVFINPHLPPRIHDGVFLKLKGQNAVLRRYLGLVDGQLSLDSLANPGKAELVNMRRVEKLGTIIGCFSYP